MPMRDACSSIGEVPSQRAVESAGLSLAGRTPSFPFMSDLKAEHVLAERARLGECPLWDPDRQRLAWVDVYNHRVHEFDPATGNDHYIETGDVVSAIALADGNHLLAALGNQLALLSLSTGELESLCRVAFPDPDSRFNDGKCDARGRFWVGSISKEPGQAALYRYDLGGAVRVMETGLTISNGLGWSPDWKTFYLTDSPARKIYAYRFDPESGSIDDRRVLVDFGAEAVEPDGLAIDQRGNLWSALWNGWCVACFDPDGRELGRISLPVQRPTSLTFGGADLTDLYVTTASVGLSQSEIQRGFYAGDLFRIRNKTPGMPTQYFHGLT
jgi:sugar lactone lactonase YvrE